MPEPTKLPVKSEPMSEMTGRRDWALFDRLRSDVDRLFGQLSVGFPWGAPGRLGPPSAASDWPSLSGPLSPAVDVIERPAAFEITAELPGLDDKDVEVKVVNGALVIRGQKESRRDETEGDCRIMERRYGSYERSFMLPDGVDPAKIEATFSKGVLTVSLPKTAAASKETKISIKAA